MKVVVCLLSLLSSLGYADVTTDQHTWDCSDNYYWECSWSTDAIHGHVTATQGSFTDNSQGAAQRACHKDLCDQLLMTDCGPATTTYIDVRGSSESFLCTFGGLGLTF